MHITQETEARDQDYRCPPSQVLMMSFVRVLCLPWQEET